MGTLGHKVFIPLTKAKSAALPKEAEETETSEDTIFYLSRAIKQYNITIHAKARQTSEGFVVLAGGIVSPKDDNTIQPGVKEVCYRQKRERLDILENKGQQNATRFRR